MREQLNALARRTLGKGQRAAIKRVMANTERQLLHMKARRCSGDLVALATLFGTDKWGGHWYAPHYQRHFEAVRHRKLVVMEIGIGGYDRPWDGGHSLRAWKWFFPNSLIVGLDLYDKKQHEEDRIRTYQGSQDDPEFLKRVVSEVGRPDIIIDDGSHLNPHVLVSFNTLFPLLKDDGIYAVEDTQSAYWPTWGGSMDEYNRMDTSMGFLKSLIDGLNHSEYIIPGYKPSYNDKHIVALHFYHNLVFVMKGVNDETSTMVTNGVLRTS